MEISAVNNQLVKDCVKLQQKKYRQQTNKFLIEGYKAIKEAFDYGIEIEYVFVENSHLAEYSFLKNKLIKTNEAVLKKISTTDSAPSAIAIGYQKEYSKEDFIGMKKVILLEDIKDLGNLGTIIRSSVAFGVDGIVLYGESADIYNPKCVRAAVGNLWKIPIINVKDFSTLNNLFGNFERIATLPATKNLLSKTEFKYPLLIMFGCEASGLSKELIDFATKSVKIEMSENVESLNLSVSVSILLYSLFIIN